jgi:enamine deaminase RidA (YjgF/YER057c/UK114 family)
MEIQSRRAWFGKVAWLGALSALLSSSASSQNTPSRRYIKNPGTQARAYSPAVITQGGTTIWLAGQTASMDESGRVLDFEGQVRQLFSQFAKTLQEAGGKLSDIVTMTVFITDIRNAEQFLRIRRETFGDNFPASALIEITALVPPQALIEIQAVAVVE